MAIRKDLQQAWKDLRRFGPGFALSGLRARGGKLALPLDLLARPGTSKRGVPDRVLVSVPIGGRSVPMWVRRGDSDLATIRQVFRDGDYDISLFSQAARVKARLDAIIAGGRTPVIIDAGANIGAATMWFKHAFPHVAIVAVEPEPANAALLRDNTAEFGNVTVIEAAIGARPGFVALSNTDLSWGVRTARAPAGLPVVTIDDALAAVPNGEAFIVKIDIEGFESDLFADNLEWLEKPAVIVIEPHDWMLPGQGSSRSFQRAMAEHPFEILLSGENLIYVRI